MIRERSRSHRAGFTLIELIVTIVILGILAALAVPALSAVIDRSRQDALEQTALAMGRELSAVAAFDTVGFDAGDTTATGANDQRTRRYLDELYAVVYDGGVGASDFATAPTNAPVFGRLGQAALVGGTSAQFGNSQVFVVADEHGDGQPDVGERCTQMRLPGQPGQSPQIVDPATMTWQGPFSLCS